MGLHDVKLQVLAALHYANNDLSEGEYERMTDGVVSLIDRIAASDTSPELSDAVEEVMDGQGFGTTAGETLKDSVIATVDGIGNFFARLRSEPQGLERPSSGVRLRGR